MSYIVLGGSGSSASTPLMCCVLSDGVPPPNPATLSTPPSGFAFETKGCVCLQTVQEGGDSKNSRNNPCLVICLSPRTLDGEKKNQENGDNKSSSSSTTPETPQASTDGAAAAAQASSSTGATPPAEKGEAVPPAAAPPAPEDIARRYILIDATKTMRQTVLRCFRQNNITFVDSVILTHDHSDATLGMDDLRELQERGRGADGRFVAKHNRRISIFGTQETLERVQTVFPYMFPAFSDPSACDRWVSNLAPRPFKFLEPFLHFGINILPLPVLHGGSYECAAFLIGSGPYLLYMSDVSSVTENVLALLQEKGKNEESKQVIEHFIVDALSPIRPHPSHFGFPDALELSDKIGAKQVILTGLSHQWWHEEDSEILRQRYAGRVVLGFDGMRIETPYL